MSWPLSALHFWALLAAPAVAFVAVRQDVSGPVYGLHSARRVGLPIRTAASLSCAVVLAGVVAVAPSGPQAWASTLLFGALLYLAAFDLRHLAVPVWPTLGLVGAGALISGLERGPTAGLLSLAVAGAIWLLFRALEVGYFRWRGVAGLGSGDALVGAALGAWMGAVAAAWSVALGCAVTLLFVLAAAVVTRKSVGPIPLVPGLALGALVVFLGDLR